MGALQPGLPSPVMLPQKWPLLIIDLKDCFFTIPLCSQDTQRFAFTFGQAQNSHDVFHQNARALRRQFGLSHAEAHGIVRACPQCSHHGPGLG
ncbi:POK25 protein, partial [Pomatorhinus ruficollis]|nr:POK25 protein [Pomatorhinus ruficollis]